MESWSRQDPKMQVSGGNMNRIALLVMLIFAGGLVCVGTAGAADPVIHYEFDCDYTDSAGSYDGTPENSSGFDIGWLNQSVLFPEGKHGYVDTSYDRADGAPFTMNIWVYIEENINTGSYFICGMKNGEWPDEFWLEYKNGYLKISSYTDDGYDKEGAYSLDLSGEWHMLTFAYDGDQKYLGIDGEYVTEHLSLIHI